MVELNELLEDLNAKVAKSLAYPKVQYFQQASLQEKDERIFPVVDHGNRRGEVIYPYTKDALTCYHRIIEVVTETDPAGGYGKYPYRTRIYTMRMVWFGSLKYLPSKTYDSNDQIKNDVYAALPVSLTGKQKVLTTAENTNRQEVWEEEFAGNDMTHLNLDLVAFYIEYELRQRVNC